MKATHWKISQKFLEYKTPKNTDFKKPKWIVFCEHFISIDDVSLSLYEARKTASKYITVTYKDQYDFKVRFSNHKPIAKREMNKDCDFFVGVNNSSITTTDMAILAVKKWLKEVQQKI